MVRKRVVVRISGGSRCSPFFCERGQKTMQTRERAVRKTTAISPQTNLAALHASSSRSRQGTGLRIERSIFVCAFTPHVHLVLQRVAYFFPNSCQPPSCRGHTYVCVTGHPGRAPNLNESLHLFTFFFVFSLPSMALSSVPLTHYPPLRLHS